MDHRNDDTRDKDGYKYFHRDLSSLTTPPEFVIATSSVRKTLRQRVSPVKFQSPIFMVFQCFHYRVVKIQSASYPMRKPPLISRTAPVMYPASSLARNTIAAATSAFVPMRPRGTRVSNPSFTSCGNGSVMGETMNPGATAFTVIFRDAISTAKARVKPISPAFAAT